MNIAVIEELELQVECLIEAHQHLREELLALRAENQRLTHQNQQAVEKQSQLASKLESVITKVRDELSSTDKQHTGSQRHFDLETTRSSHAEALME